MTNNGGLERWQNFFLTLFIVALAGALTLHGDLDAQAMIGLLGAAIPTGALIHHQTNNQPTGDVAQEGPTTKNAADTNDSTRNSESGSGSTVASFPVQGAEVTDNKVPPFNG